MSKKTKVEVTRENFLKMRGGKLISIEAYILAIAVFIILATVKNASPVVSLIIAGIVGFVFPILVGTFKSLAWLATTLFSLVWGFLTFVFVGAIANGSVLIGLLFGIAFFAISFWVHKNYSGLSFRGISKKTHTQQIATNEEATYEAVQFCPKCGRRIRSIDGRCDSCDN